MKSRIRNLAAIVTTAYALAQYTGCSKPPEPPEFQYTDQERGSWIVTHNEDLIQGVNHGETIFWFEERYRKSSRVEIHKISECDAFEIYSPSKEQMIVINREDSWFELYELKDGEYIRQSRISEIGKGRFMHPQNYFFVDICKG